MALQLSLLRHAKSSWSDPERGDRERPLNGRGQRSAATVGRHLREWGIEPELVLCSSARRTIQTLELLALDPGVEVAVEDDLYGASAGDLLARLWEVTGMSRVMVIGHNPGIQDFAVSLTGADDQLLSFPTAALAHLEAPIDGWDDLRPGVARLVRFVVPREL